MHWGTPNHPEQALGTNTNPYAQQQSQLKTFHQSTEQRNLQPADHLFSTFFTQRLILQPLLI